MERLLGPHEAAIAAAGVRVVLCSDVNGEVDEAVLAAALSHLRARHPLLAGSIVAQDGDARWLVRMDADAQGPALGQGVDLVEEINAPLTWSRGPLLRLTLLRESERTRVVMTLPRAFVDGMSYLALHHRLWALYTALRTNQPVHAEPVQPELGPPLDDLLAARFTARQLRDFVAERARLDAEAPPALLPTLASVDGGPGPDLSCHIIGIDIDAERAERLAQCARDASLSLNALVSGVLLTSLRPLLPAPGGPARILCTTAVDMRRRLSPRLPAEVLQSAATTTSTRLQVDDRAHPIEVGQHLAAQLRADVDSGAAAMELAAFSHMINQHPPSLVITNVGAIPEPALARGLQISDVRIAPLGHVPMVFAVVSRYQGRLAIDLTYSRAWFAEAQIQDLARRTSATLDGLTT
ncbi:condensation protein [Streptomyces buecherae]|uniref:Phthiocerol/phthiodiolone dimycocerosyl transferase n=2 Tax=Streptomyces buecherae TaxID=2763006 RepID=A0A7H8NK83_9ACTN|nr:condensation protein [Streptomyces buecherae]